MIPWLYKKHFFDKMFLLNYNKNGGRQFFHLFGSFVYKKMKIGDSNGAPAPAESGISLSGGAPAASTGGGISLTKGEKVSLSKVALDKGISSPLDKLTVGLGWDINNFTGAAFDLDASAFLVDANEKVLGNSGFVFYGQPSDSAGSVFHSGDNKTGEGDGDDEQLKVCLSKIPAEIQKVVFTVTIYDCKTRNQNFGQVKNAFIRVVDDATNTELIRYDLTEDFSTQTALVVAEIYRHNNEWKFNPVGSGYPDDLATFCARYGVQLA